MEFLKLKRVSAFPWMAEFLRIEKRSYKRKGILGVIRKEIFVVVGAEGFAPPQPGISPTFVLSGHSVKVLAYPSFCQTCSRLT